MWTPWYGLLIHSSRDKIWSRKCLFDHVKPNQIRECCICFRRDVSVTSDNRGLWVQGLRVCRVRQEVCGVQCGGLQWCPHCPVRKHWHKHAHLRNCHWRLGEHTVCHKVREVSYCITWCCMYYYWWPRWHNVCSDSQDTVCIGAGWHNVCSDSQDTVCIGGQDGTMCAVIERILYVLGAKRAQWGKWYSENWMYWKMQERAMCANE